MHAAVFHYVPVPQGFAAVTIVHFECGVCNADDIPNATYQTTVTCSLLLHNFDPFLYDSENDY